MTESDSTSPNPRPGGSGSPERKKLLVDASRHLAGHAIGAVGLIAGIRVMTELLDPGAYGTVALILGLISLHSSLFPVPVGHAIGRMSPQVAANQRHRLLLQSDRLILRSVAVAGTAMAIGYMIECMWSAGAILPSMFLGTASVALLAAEAYRCPAMAAAIADRRSGLAASWHAAELWLRPLLAVGLVCLMPLYPVAATLAGYALASGVLVVWGRHAMRSSDPRNAAVADLRRRLVRFALPLMPMAIVAWINGLADRYLIAALIDLNTVGLYAAVYGLSGRAVRIVGVVAAHTFRPAYYTATVGGRTGLARRLLMVWIVALVACLGVGVLIAALFAELIAGLLLAPEYRHTAWLIPLLVGAHIPLMLADVAAVVNMSRDRPANVTLADSAGAVATLVAAPLLLLHYGLAGAAVATGVAYTIQCGVGWWLAARE